MTNTHTQTEDHKRQVEAGVQTLDLLESLLTVRDPEDLDPSHIETLKDLGLWDPDLSPQDQDWDPRDLFWEVLGTETLEVYLRGSRRSWSPNWEVDSVVLVFGTGGPHTEAEIDSSGRAVVKCWTWYHEGLIEESGLDYPVLFETLTQEEATI